MKLKISLVLLAFLFIFSSFSFIVDAQNSNVLVVEITDTIDQSSVEILTESMQQAKNQNSQAIILLLDTPGGGLQQTFDIAGYIAVRFQSSGMFIPAALRHGLLELSF